MKVRWLDRTLFIGPFITLVTTEDELDAVLKRLKFRGDKPPFLGSLGGDGATTHILDNPHGDCVCIVTCHFETRDPVNVAALMAHEAVHIWKAQLECIGEDKPGEEIEAYAVQALTARLYDEAIRRGLADQPQG